MLTVFLRRYVIDLLPGRSWIREYLCEHCLSSPRYGNQQYNIYYRIIREPRSMKYGHGKLLIMGTPISLTARICLDYVSRFQAEFLLDTRLTIAGVDWQDNSRDILNFLINYLPTIATDSLLPTHLPSLSSSEAESRKYNGYKHRELVVVGHSFGGCTSCVSLLDISRTGS